MKYEFFFLMRRYFKLNKKKEILQCFFLRSRLNKIFFLKLLEKYIQFFNFSIYYCQNIAKRIKQIPIYLLQFYLLFSKRSTIFVFCTILYNISNSYFFIFTKGNETTHFDKIIIKKLHI